MLEKIEALSKVIRINRNSWMMFGLHGGHSVKGFAPSDPDQNGVLCLKVQKSGDTLLRYIYIPRGYRLY